MCAILNKSQTNYSIHGERVNPPFQVYHALRTQSYLNQKW